MESFVLARKRLAFLTANKIPSVILKVDFIKAFDSISWDFLQTVLIQNGFPARWNQWIHNLLISSSSFVRANGSSGQTFFHQRGLRQGDPLSPLLFILATGALQHMLIKIQLLLTPIPLAPTQLLQFADDTLIITPAHANNLAAIQKLLDSFASLSGLQINLTKSGFLPIATPPQTDEVISSILGCPKLTLPMSYLGLPLTTLRPNRAACLPLLQKINGRLEGWKNRLLSQAGQATLINSVVNALPLHYMQAFLLPKWLINKIELTKRRFFWRGHQAYSGGHCLASWGMVCLPKDYGGLGIQCILMQNQALLIKWLWIIQTKPSSPFTLFLNSLP